MAKGNKTFIALFVMSLFFSGLDAFAQSGNASAGLQESYERSIKQVNVPSGVDQTYMQVVSLTLSGCLQGCFGDANQTVPLAKCEEFCACSTNGQIKAVSVTDFVADPRNTPLNVMQARVNAAEQCKQQYKK